MLTLFSGRCVCRVFEELCFPQIRALLFQKNMPASAASGQVSCKTSWPKTECATLQKTVQKINKELRNRFLSQLQQSNTKLDVEFL